jgi:hypothetical protein
MNFKLPDDLRKRLEAKADAAGVSLDQYVLDELTRVASFPTLEEMTERLSKLPRVKTTRDPVDVIREVRDGGRRTP